MARKTGNVKWFSNEKGYGFIEQEDGDDVFVHHSDIQGDGYKTLKQGEVVQYEIIQADKGPKAQNVVRSEDGDGGSSDRSGPEEREASEKRSSPDGDGRDRQGEPEAESSLAQQLRDKLSERFLGGS